MSEATTSPNYPNVPKADGVPPVLREPGAFAAEDAAAPMTEDGQVGSIPNGQWGIFDQNGDPVLVADSVLTVDYRKETKISDYPVEQGGFASYNKVAIPFDAKIGMTIGGSNSDRSEFLTSAESLVGSLALYSVATPEFIYPSVNVVHYDFRRAARNGVSLLTVDFWLEEVRVTASAQYTNTKAASGAAAQNGGTVQTKAPTSAVAKPSIQAGPDTASTSGFA